MKKVKFYILFLLCCWAFAQNTFAQATLSVQGTVQKSTGATVDDGDYKLTFKLYTDETGGTAVWSEVQDPVSIVGGVYSVTLGSVTPLTAAFDQTYYLGITVGAAPELTPRARLTSSPYSLALIGQGNIVPSTGTVGIGTTTPTAGNELHVKNGAAAAKVLVEGATGSEIQFKNGANTASITYDGANINVQNLNLSSYSPAELTVTSNLAVGQASVDPNNAFKVNGTSFLGGFVEIISDRLLSWPGGRVHSSADQSNYVANAQTTGFSLRVQGRIWGTEIWAGSDRRIKKDFHRSENLTDLSMLQKLRVTDYRHIDVFGKGSELKKGFIAQEVKDVFAEAVTVAPDFIPNVYAASTRTQLGGSKMTISLDKNHEFAVGDEVKLMLPEGGEKRAAVLAVIDANTFVVDWTGEAAAAQVFVYGKKINDFHSVDYDRIFTLNVSATQELARRVEQLEAENAALRQRNDGLQQQNDGLRSDVSDIYKRLQSLEKKASGNLEK